MSIRTDLVLEQRELHTENLKGIESSDTRVGDVKINRVFIRDDEAAAALSKPPGKYFTIEFERLESIGDIGNIKKAVVTALNELLPENRQSILVVGLGNSDITPDALGPLTANGLLVTRHISSELAKSIGLEKLKSVSAIIPGVLGKTGIEVLEIIRGTAERTKPSAMIVIDALAARRPSRLCCTIQLSDSGICPGSGVNNARKEISSDSFGIPVIAVGIPTVVDVRSLVYDLSGKTPEKTDGDMMVTPKDIDMLIERASEILSQSLNLFLQPGLDEEIILGLV